MSTNHGSIQALAVGVTWITDGDERSKRYLDAVVAGGGQPVPMLADCASWKAELNSIRGLLLTGGVDIDPQLYGEKNEGLSIGVNRQRDDLELQALRYCLDRGLPVLAICRGFQLVNVAIGGALIQDIRSSIKHKSDRGQSRFHEIAVIPGTRIAEVVGGQLHLRVNGRHHQGVDLHCVAQKLHVTALAPDNIVEGLELEGDQFLVGVQSHPENMDETPQLVGLFAAFVSAVRAT